MFLLDSTISRQQSTMEFLLLSVTSNNINNFNINNHIAAGNINLYGGTSDGNTLIRTHNGQAENDVTIGSRG